VRPSRHRVQQTRAVGTAGAAASVAPVSDPQDRLAAWFAARLGVERVTIDDFAGVPTGHSAETIKLTLAWDDDGPQRRDVVVRVRPEPPGLLEPYDLRMQFDLLRALEPTPVRAPTVLWYEETGTVLGREAFAMDCAEGTVYERTIPAELTDDPARVRRMSEELVDELVAIHDVDVSTLPFLGDGTDSVARELAHWTAEMRRVQRGPLPALERLLAELERRAPAPSGEITLLHGDAKPGNYAFVGDRLSATFDWEMAALGDPMMDVAYAQVTWKLRNMFTTLPSSLTTDELVTRYADRSGRAAHDLAWHRALQGFKLGVIMLLGSMLFDAGHTDDPRLGLMGHGVDMFTTPALAELGVDDPPEQGAVLPTRPLPEL
jgi:aminoglycoside phosphotransferase (APT) family kinase protein